MNNQYKSRIAMGVFLLALWICKPMWAQQNQFPMSEYTQPDALKIALYKANPVWKEMMDDPNANYFEVQKAFDLFWEGKEMPLEEDEIIGEKRKLKDTFINRLFNAQELKEQQEREDLAFDCKRYRRWLIKTEPYIHDDGSIMSTGERLELWKRHYQELNNQSNR